MYEDREQGGAYFNDAPLSPGPFRPLATSTPTRPERLQEFSTGIYEPRGIRPEVSEEFNLYTDWSRINFSDHEATRPSFDEYTWGERIAPRFMARDVLYPRAICMPSPPPVLSDVPRPRRFKLPSRIPELRRPRQSGEADMAGPRSSPQPVATGMTRPRRFKLPNIAAMLRRPFQSGETGMARPRSPPQPVATAIPSPRRFTQPIATGIATPRRYPRPGVGSQQSGATGMTRPRLLEPGVISLSRRIPRLRRRKRSEDSLVM